MLDYVISTFYPEIQEAYSDNSIQRNAAFFKEVRKIRFSSSIHSSHLQEHSLKKVLLMELLINESNVDIDQINESSLTFLITNHDFSALGELPRTCLRLLRVSCTTRGNSGPDCQMMS